MPLVIVGRGYIRACYASSLENIKEALIRMERFIKNLEQSK